MTGNLSLFNTVLPILVWFFNWNVLRETNDWDDQHDYEWWNEWDWTMWYDRAWNLVPIVGPITWGPVFMMWVGIAMFESPLAALALSYWMYFVMFGAIAGLAPWVCMMISWWSNEWLDNDVFWMWFFAATGMFNAAFVFLFAMPVMDFLDDKEEGLAREFHDNANWEDMRHDWKDLWNGLDASVTGF